MKKRKKLNPAQQLGKAIGVGLIAGLAGTVAISLSQMIEMKLTRRKPSTVPEEAVSKTLDVQAVSNDKKEKVSQEVHWVYGTSWGISRGLLSLAGLKSWPATLAHFSAVWGASMIMLPKLELAPPVQQREAKTMLIDGLHHAVYAVVAGLVFDAIEGERW